EQRALFEQGAGQAVLVGRDTRIAIYQVLENRLRLALGAKRVVAGTQQRQHPAELHKGAAAIDLQARVVRLLFDQLRVKVPGARAHLAAQLFEAALLHLRVLGEVGKIGDGGARDLQVVLRPDAAVMLLGVGRFQLKVRHGREDRDGRDQDSD